MELLGLGPDLMVSNSTWSRPSSNRRPTAYRWCSSPSRTRSAAASSRPGAADAATSRGLPISNLRWGANGLELLQQMPRNSNALGSCISRAPNIGYLKSAEAAAPSFNRKLIGLEVHGGTEIEGAVAPFAAEPHSGMIIAPNVVTFANSDLIVALAARYRLPTIYPFAFLQRQADWRPTGSTRLSSSARGRDMSIGYSGVPDPRTCPCSILRSSSSSSTSIRQDARSRPFRRSCFRSPTR